MRLDDSTKTPPKTAQYRAGPPQMTRAANTPAAEFKPIKNAPAAHDRMLKNAAKTAKTKRPRNTFKREIGQLPGRKRDGYAQQLAAMVEISLVLLWTANIATGYAFVSLTELANSTDTGTQSAAGWKGYGRTSRALARLRQLGYIRFTRALLHPQNGGRDRLMITVTPKLYALFGTNEKTIQERGHKALMALISKTKKAAENGNGLPISTLDALAEPTTAARLLGLWQWYKYSKTDFRRFFLAVRRAGLPIAEPTAHIHPAFDSPPIR